MAKQKDIHTEHCCKSCGCKYGEDNSCTVVVGAAGQTKACGKNDICNSGLEYLEEED